MILPSSGDLRRCWHWWFIDHSQHQIYRREARMVYAFGRRFPHVRPCFWCYRRRRCSRWWNWKPRWTADQQQLYETPEHKLRQQNPQHQKLTPKHLNTKSMEESRLLCLSPSCYLKPPTYILLVHILNFLGQPKVATNPPKLPFQ